MVKNPTVNAGHRRCIDDITMTVIANTECLPSTGHDAKCSTWIISFNFPNNSLK